MCGSRFIDRAAAGLEKETCLIQMFFKREMLPVHEKAIRFRELVNVHLEMRGKALGIPFLKIDKTRLFAAGTATPALKKRDRH